MAKEVLVIPEDRLIEFIAIIRAGLSQKAEAFPLPISKNTKDFLKEWCDEEQEYLNRLSELDNS